MDRRHSEETLRERGQGSSQIKNSRTAVGKGKWSPSFEGGDRFLVPTPEEGRWW